MLAAIVNNMESGDCPQGLLISKSIEDDVVTIEENGEEKKFNLKQIAKSNIHFDFTDI